MTFNYHVGASPLLVSMPHIGTDLPDDIAGRMTDEAHRLTDTDWHLDRLYDFLGEFDASVLQARFSRYVIDLNRPPDDTNLYPGQNTTGLYPIDTFDHNPLYQEGGEPATGEIDHRISTYWKPYHEQLGAALAGIRDQYGYALLWDAHSIRSQIPRLFEGRLPDLNLGTASGNACPADLAASLERIAQSVDGYRGVLNGRFRGGYITRHYGKPANGVIAVQLELTQDTYMEEAYPFAFADEKAERLRTVLRELLACYTAWMPSS